MLNQNISLIVNNVIEIINYCAPENIIPYVRMGWPPTTNEEAKTIRFLQYTDQICQTTGIITGIDTEPSSLELEVNFPIDETTPTTFTGYLKGNGSGIYATATIPFEDVEGLGTAASYNVDADISLTADSDELIPTQHAVKTYVDALDNRIDAQLKTIYALINAMETTPIWGGNASMPSLGCEV